MRERSGQGIEGQSDEIVVAVIGKRQGVVASDEPAQHTVRITGVARALVIHAAAAEGVRHEVGACDPVAPEWSTKQEAHSQVVCRDGRSKQDASPSPAKLAAAPFESLQPVVGQGEDDHVERMILVSPPAIGPSADRCRPGSLANGNDRAAEAHVRGDAFLEPVDEPLDPADDRIQAKVTGVVHEDVLQSVQRGGQVRFGRRSLRAATAMYLRAFSSGISSRISAKVLFAQGCRLSSCGWPS